MIALIKILHIAVLLLSGWLVMHAMSYLIPVSAKKLPRLFLFFGCLLLCSMTIFIGDPFNILATTPVFLIIVVFTCNGALWQRITIGLMFSSTILSFNALRDNYIHDLLFSKTWTQYGHGYLISCTFILPFSLILYLCTRKFAPDKDYTLSDSMWHLLFLLTIIPLGIVLSIVTLFRPSGFYFDIFLHREYAFLLLIALLAFISLFWCVTVLARQRKLEQQNTFAEINRRYYESMEQQHFEIRRLKHDLANHIQVLSALPEEKRAPYAKELSGNAALSQSFTCCGDPTVNAVLTVKKGVMERCSIRLNAEIDIPSPLPYDRTDICALYANALDNAMEACMKLDETYREIFLKSKAGKGLFCLEISNPAPVLENGTPAYKPKKGAASVSGKISEHGPLLPTSKPDKTNHGFGLQSMQEIVKRFHGNLEIKIENGIFDLFLYLPLPEYPVRNQS